MTYYGYKPSRLVCLSLSTGCDKEGKCDTKKLQHIFTTTQSPTDARKIYDLHLYYKHIV